MELTLPPVSADVDGAASALLLQAVTAFRQPTSKENKRTIRTTKQQSSARPLGSVFSCFSNAKRVGCIEYVCGIK